jgi:mannitol-specific phosphotransferase system IIBC component
MYDQLLSVLRGSFGPALLLTFGLGVVHAVSPGHGKTLVVASLLGSQGSLNQVLILAVTVAVTHTAGVLLLRSSSRRATRCFPRRSRRTSPSGPRSSSSSSAWT